MSGRCIAMWSGPRNISTAMMRSWENRPDTKVIDEPFYAHYLEHTNIDHPMAREVIQQGETEWQTVVDGLTQIPDSGIFYQKHICTHWLDHYSTDWLGSLSHVFLIRAPDPVVASYSIKREALTADDLGYSQQSELFELIRSKCSQPPIVIDSQRFLKDPETQLREVCRRLQIAFYPEMLQWPQGTRKSDGVWGAHWYDAVNRSTGFMSAATRPVNLDKYQQEIADTCRPCYEAMLAYAL